MLIIVSQIFFPHPQTSKHETHVVPIQTSQKGLELLIVFEPNDDSSRAGVDACRVVSP